MNEVANIIIAILLKIPLYLMLWTLERSNQGTMNKIAMLAAKIINPKNLLVIPKKGIPKVTALRIE